MNCIIYCKAIVPDRLKMTKRIKMFRKTIDVYEWFL